MITDNRNGDKKLLLMQNCEMRYTSSMEREKIHYKAYVKADYMDHVSSKGFVTKSDYFLLRGLLFYRQATARMVANYLIYFRNCYGPKGCENMPLLQISDNQEYSEDNFEEFRKKIEHRLCRLANNNLLYCDKYTSEEIRGTVYVFTVNYYTFSFVNSAFGKEESYNGPYYNAPAHIVMRNMHACEVAVEGFNNHKPAVQMAREDAIKYGANAENYAPIMHVRVEIEGSKYHIMVEALHFGCDTSIVPEEEYIGDLKRKVEIMCSVIRHYDYIKKKYNKNENVRFLVVCENLSVMQRITIMMNEFRDVFSEKVFFTNSVTLRAFHGNLAKSVIMVKKKENKDGEYLGLIDPDIDNNKWLLASKE